MGGPELSTIVTAGRRRGPVRSAIRLAWLVVCWTILTFVVATVLLATHGKIEKYQFMAVLSGSMVPTMNVGDLVVAEVVTPDKLSDGDLATFRDPSTGRLITHRVQSILWRGNIADVITRGDANPVGENWSVTSDSKVGRVVLRMPHVGYVVGVLGTRAGEFGLAAVAAVLGLWILVAIWRPNRSGD
jgi:signal peptidase I